MSLLTLLGRPAEDAEIWFLDTALRWHFLSSTFAQYFRLMMVHLGLPQWQYAFTDVGLSPSARVKTRKLKDFLWPNKKKLFKETINNYYLFWGSWYMITKYRDFFVFVCFLFYYNSLISDGMLLIMVGSKVRFLLEPYFFCPFWQQWCNL